MKLSIIVPVYNVEAYLDECIESLVSQTYRDIEIILVNDGSTDGSGVICDRWANERPDLVKVIHRENRGASVARNTGIEAATGEWICFVDSDDWAELDMAEVMMKYAESGDVEIHVFGYYRRFADNFSKSYGYPEMIIPESAKSNFMHHRAAGGSDYGLNSPWGKCYKLDLINRNELRFAPGLQAGAGDDAIFNLHASYASNKVFLHTEILYNYRQRSSSSLHTVCHSNFQKLDKRIKCYFEFVELNSSGDLAYLMKNTYTVTELMILIRLYIASDYNRKDAVNRLHGHFNSEPFKTAIRTVPISVFPKRRRWLVFMLRIGLVGLCYRLFCLTDYFYQRIKAGKGHAMYP